MFTPKDPHDYGLLAHWTPPGHPTNRSTEPPKRPPPFTDYQPIPGRPGWSDDGYGHQAYDGLPEAGEHERKVTAAEKAKASAVAEPPVVDQHAATDTQVVAPAAEDSEPFTTMLKYGISPETAAVYNNIIADVAAGVQQELPGLAMGEWGSTRDNRVSFTAEPQRPRVEGHSRSEECDQILFSRPAGRPGDQSYITALVPQGCHLIAPIGGYVVQLNVHDAQRSWPNKEIDDFLEEFEELLPAGIELRTHRRGVHAVYPRDAISKKVNRLYWGAPGGGKSDAPRDLRRWFQEQYQLNPYSPLAMIEALPKPATFIALEHETGSTKLVLRTRRPCTVHEGNERHAYLDGLSRLIPVGCSLECKLE